VHHDWIMGLAGGLLMGIGCAALVLFNGRILGVSGLLGGALRFSADSGWRWSFIGGMVAAGAATLLLYPPAFDLQVDRSVAATLVGGILVGAGTQLGSGCTSGHGICGIGRLSPRSMVATCTFMAAGAVAVVVVQRLLGGSV